MICKQSLVIIPTTPLWSKHVSSLLGEGFIITMTNQCDKLISISVNQHRGKVNEVAIWRVYIAISIFILQYNSFDVTS